MGYRDEVKEKTQELVAKCVQKYREKIMVLDNYADFERNNLVRGRHCEPHIMYKLKNDNGKLWIDGRGGREYVFLVEFDPDDFAYGIYFGCRCTLNEYTRIATQVEECNNEWTHIKSMVLGNLNRTFVDIDFSHREIATDNVSDRTYWPFWFRLGEDEDVVSVAAQATKIIRNTYQWFFRNENYERILNAPLDEPKRRGRKSNTAVRTRYTESCYSDIISQLSNTKLYKEDAAAKFKQLIAVAERRGVLAPYPILERCWKLNWTITDFSLLFSMFYKRVAKSIEKRNQKTVIRWELITPIVISSEGNDIDNIKGEYNKVNVEEANAANSITLEQTRGDEGAQKLYDIIDEIFGK